MTEQARLSANEARAIAEALADVLVERGLLVECAPARAARVLDVSEVARLLGRKRAWVYAHAAELGAFRFGDGPKARIGFDVACVERWKRERQIRTVASLAGPQRRGSRRGGLSTDAGLIPYETAS